MRQTYRALIALFTVGTLLALPLLSIAAPVDAPAVIISEIGWAGSSLSNADEWLELTNVSDSPIDISGWAIIGAASSGGTIILPEGSSVAAHNTFLIANYDQSHEKSLLSVQPDYVTTSVSLSNSRLSLILSDNGGTTIDRAGDGGAPFAGGTSGAGGDVDGQFASMVRLNLNDGTFETSWGEGSPPTPGEVEEWLLSTPEEIEDVEELEGKGAVETEEETDVEEEEEEEEEEEAETSKQQPVFYPQGTLVINEIVSSPESGQDEWIEIYNPYNNVINLTGWRIREGSGKTTELPDYYFGWDQFVLVTNPNGKLNNSGDLIELIDPHGNIIDRVEYGTKDIPAPKKGEALARTSDGQMIITKHTTPKAINEFPKEHVEIVEETFVPKVEPHESIQSPPPSQTESNELKRVQPASPLIEQEQTDAQVSEGKSVEDPYEQNRNIGPLTLTIAAVYPNPIGEDAENEFIQIENFGTEPVNLLNWIIEDASGKQFEVKNQMNVIGNARLTLPRTITGITLNNTSDTIRLFAPDGSLIDEFTYEKSSEGNILTREGNSWTLESQASENEQGEFSKSESEENNNAIRSASLRSDSAPSHVTIRDAMHMLDDTRVTISGIASVAPGILGKQVFYIQDGETGIQVYKYDAQFPDIQVGDEVILTGTLSTSRGQRRVKIGTNDPIGILSSGNVLNATSVPISDIDPGAVGSLIQTEGIVLTSSGDKVIIEQNGIELMIRLAGGVDIPSDVFERGSSVRVNGILTTYDGSLRLLPRYQKDVRPLEEKEHSAAALTGKEEREQQDGRNALIIGGATLIALLALAAKHYLPNVKTRYAKNHPVGRAA